MISLFPLFSLCVCFVCFSFGLACGGLGITVGSGVGVYYWVFSFVRLSKEVCTITITIRLVDDAVD